MARPRSGLGLNIETQLSFYGSYHSHPLNQAIHFVFVPLILWTVAVWLAYTPPLLAWDVAAHLPAALPAWAATFAGYLVFNGSFVLLAAYSAYYLLLEPVAGGTWAAAVALPLWGGANAFRAAVPAAWAWALGLHALSWLVQVVVGHNLLEGRKPALLDSFFQSLILAPLFVWMELLWLCGYRPALRARVAARVRAATADWKRQTAPLLAGEATSDRSS